MSWIPGWNSVADAGWWSGFFFWASIASLIGLGISEIASHRYSDRKDELVTDQQRVDKKNHDDEIARLHLETAQANERAAKLQEAAAWRVLSPEAKAGLADNLRNAGGGLVEISYPANDPEALFLASQIEGVFKQLNAEKKPPLLWNVTVQPRQFSKAIFWDLRIFGQNLDEVETLRRSFMSARVPFLTEPVPNILNDSPGMLITGGAAAPATIFVGPKRPFN